jgi:puromycin-sensitive aminopeptidase
VEQASAYRLSRTVTPSHYDLVLTPDLTAATFTGVVAVTVDVAEATSEIVLNALDLEIYSVILTSVDDARRSGRAQIDVDEQRAVLRFDEPIPAGSGYRLELEFSGILNDKLHGFYRSSFTDDDGHGWVIATTQFEPADARRAFPCWDEPDFKATFSVILVVPATLAAISNGEIEADEPLDGGLRRVRFATTMVMSTYLLAFIVGPFALTEPADVDGVPLRIATPPGRSQLTPYATEVGVHALRFLSSYFELPYPSDKIDHVAIPDFAFGAMENLGCVTYRETALLVDTAAASQLELQRVAQVVAHETAHMWFGDLVTMKWWNGIWLNEAFATFMELTTTDDLRPDWDVWTAFGMGKAAAMAIDGLRATRPVEFTVGRPEEAEAMFDVLTYQKGGAVLRMLEQYLGPDTFRRGIARYLAEHSYGNTETSDLWEALEATSGEPVRHTMDSWILQGGYPLLSVVAGPGEHELTVSQERFLYAGGAGSAERWVVPVNLRASVAGKVETRRVLLDADSLVLPFDGPVDWVVLNDGAWGFYRVRYGPELLAGFSGAAAGGQTTPLERMALVSDTWAAVLAGKASLEELVTLLLALRHEEDPDVWATMLGPLYTLDLVIPTDDRPALSAFVRRLVGPAFDRLGWDPAPDEPQRQGILRGRLISFLGVLGVDATVRAEASRRFAQHLAHGEKDRQNAGGGSLAPDVVTAAVNVAVADGGVKTWETVRQQFHQAINPQDRIRYLQALTSTEDPELLIRALEATLTPEVRSQDAPFVISGVLGGRSGRALAWPWLTGHWEQIQSKLPANLLVRVLEGLTALTDPELAAEAHAWIAATDLPIGGPRLAQLEERLDINVALGQRIGASIAATLERPS